MVDNQCLVKQYPKINSHIRSKSRSGNEEINIQIRRQDMYHNKISSCNDEISNQQLPQQNQFSLDLSKIRVNNTIKSPKPLNIEQNKSYQLYLQELDSQYQQAVNDQIISERTKKQAQLYIPNLNQYLEDYKKRKFYSSNVSSKIISKNPNKYIQCPKEYIEKLADDMMNSFREGKTCTKYEQIMDFIKGKPFELKLGEMNYKQGEKNKSGWQELPSNLQFQHIRTRNQQMGERPQSREKRREYEEKCQFWMEQESLKDLLQKQQNGFMSGRNTSMQQRRERMYSQIKQRDQSEDLQNKLKLIDQIKNDISQSPTSKVPYLAWNPPSERQNIENIKMNIFLTHRSTPKQTNKTIQNKKFLKNLSISRSTIDGGIENDFTNDQPSTKKENSKSPFLKPIIQKQRINQDSSYNTFLTQDFVQSNFVNSSQKQTNKKDQNVSIQILGDQNIQDKNQSIQIPSLFNQYSPFDDNTFHSSSPQNNPEFDQQNFQKLNLNVEEQSIQKVQEKENKVSFFQRLRPGSEMRIDDYKTDLPITSNFSFRIQNSIKNKSRSAASRRFPSNNNSFGNLVCGGILVNCTDIIKGSSIEQIGEADYFNEKYYVKNFKQNEKKHKLNKELVTIWQQNKQHKQIKQSLKKEIEEQSTIIKEFKEEQPLIKNQVLRAGAMLDRYFQNQNVIKPFFQKKVQKQLI